MARSMNNGTLKYIYQSWCSKRLQLRPIDIGIIILPNFLALRSVLAHLHYIPYTGYIWGGGTAPMGGNEWKRKKLAELGGVMS